MSKKWRKPPTGCTLLAGGVCGVSTGCESVESVCDVSPHSSMAKPNLLTVTLGPTGEAVFSSEVAKGFSRFRDAGAGSAMGNVHTCGPNECVIISGESGLDK